MQKYTNGEYHDQLITALSQKVDPSDPAAKDFTMRLVWTPVKLVLQKMRSVGVQPQASGDYQPSYLDLLFMNAALNNVAEPRDTVARVLYNYATNPKQSIDIPVSQLFSFISSDLNLTPNSIRYDLARQMYEESQEKEALLHHKPIRPTHRSNRLTFIPIQPSAHQNKENFPVITDVPYHDIYHLSSGAQARIRDFDPLRNKIVFRSEHPADVKVSAHKQGNGLQIFGTGGDTFFLEVSSPNGVKSVSFEITDLKGEQKRVIQVGERALHTSAAKSTGIAI